MLAVMSYCDIFLSHYWLVEVRHNVIGGGLCVNLACRDKRL